MKLTGKCKDEFLTHNNITEQNLLFGYSEREINSLIIEFFDTSELLKGFNSFENIFYMEYRSTGFKDRKKATEKAIEKANLIYNDMI